MGEVYSHSAEGELQLSALRSKGISTLPLVDSAQAPLISYSDFRLPPAKNEILPFTGNGIPPYTRAEKAKRLIDSGKVVVRDTFWRKSAPDYAQPHTKELTSAVWVKLATLEAREALMRFSRV